MAGFVSVGRTNDQNIDGLLTGARWEATALAYSFPADGSVYEKSYGSGEPHSNFGSLNAIQIAAARSAFGMIAAVTGLSFVEKVETTTSHATVRLAMSDVPASAWTYTPGGSQEGGDTWFRNSGGWYDAPVPGTYAFYTFIHEIVHAVGLKHGHETDGYGPMSRDRDSMEYSVTTYRSYIGASGLHVENETGGYAQTLMMYDIAALQHMYGADFSTRNGDTVYRWDPATGQTFIDGVGQAAPAGNRVFMTIWDGGGIDTYDLSTYATPVTVDLRPGEWSKTSAEQLAYLGGGQYARGNVANALLHQGDVRSLIENAIGGSGADQVTGNAAANALSGGNGSDRLSGLESNDTLRGGGGNDTLAGNAGRDSFIFDARPSRTANSDRIVDFNVADDGFILDNGVFTKLMKTGKLSSAAFWTGAAAHDANDRIIYNKATGAVLYDADGTGRTASVQFAVVGKNLKMSPADFFVV
jgi:serralysin